MARPAPTTRKAYVFVDRREGEEAIVRYVAERPAPEDALTPRAGGDDLWVGCRGQEHRIPLTISRHDRNQTRAKASRSTSSAFPDERIMRKRPDQAGPMVQRPSISVPSPLTVPS